MRLPCFSKGLVSLGLLAFLAGASSCSSDYGLFAINVTFASSVVAQDRDMVENCKLTVSDDSDKLLKDFSIEPIGNPGDPEGTLLSGCAGNRTPQIVGRPAVSYSTSRASGKLTFTVNALDHNDKVLYTGSRQADIKVFHGKADEQTVDIELAKAAP